jgi:enoyl-CoA hydratase
MGANLEPQGDILVCAQQLERRRILMVKFEKRDRIAYISLNRPEALNALNDQLNAELARAWTDFANDDSLDIAILTGEGRAFCAGADLKSFIPKWETATPLDLRENAKQGLGGGITRGKHRIYKPIIAAVNGIAVGAGFELALACDIRIASTQAKFGVFEVRYGLHQGDGGLVRLLAIAGLGVAMELTLTGRQVSAEEALQLRLVHKVVPPADLMKEAEACARIVLANSQRAIRSAKETLLDIVGRPLDDALRLETLNSYSCLGDFSEARARLQAAGFLK